MTLTLIIEGRPLRSPNHRNLTSRAGTAEAGGAFVIQGDAQHDALMQGAELLPGITRPSGLFVPRPKTERLVIYRDTLQSLVNKGEITSLEERAGLEIRDVYQLLFGGSSPGVGSYSEMVALPNGESVPARYGDAVVLRYEPWKAWARLAWINRARSRSAYDVAIIICGWGYGKRQAADALGMDHRQVLKHLRRSLSEYAQIGGWRDRETGGGGACSEAA